MSAKRNISMGFRRGGVFHPIRASADYNSARVGENETSPSHLLGQFARAKKRRDKRVMTQQTRKNPSQPEGTATERVVTYYRTPKYSKGREWLERELGQMRLFEYNPATVKVLKVGEDWGVFINSQLFGKPTTKAKANQIVSELKARAARIQKTKRNPSEYEADVAADVANEFLDVFDVDNDGELDRQDVQFFEDYKPQIDLDEITLVVDAESETTGEILTETIDGDLVISWADGETTIENADDLMIENGWKSWRLRRKAAGQYKKTLKAEEKLRKARSRQAELESELKNNPGAAVVYTQRDENGNLNLFCHQADDNENFDYATEILFEGELADAISFAENEANFYGYKYANVQKINPGKIRKTLKRNPSGWFAGCSTADEVKTRYKELAKQYHPDKPGGDLRKMQEINAEYDKAIKYAGQNEPNDFKREADESASETLREAIQFAVTLPEDVIITIRGNWLWLEGNTYYAKDLIKSFESSDGNYFKFANKKKAWFFAAVPSKNKRGEMSFEEIDALHGKQTVSGRKPIFKLNPGLLSVFSELAVGTAAALEINRQVRKRKPTNKKRNPQVRTISQIVNLAAKQGKSKVAILKANIEKVKTYIATHGGKIQRHGIRYFYHLPKSKRNPQPVSKRVKNPPVISQARKNPNPTRKYKRNDAFSEFQGRKHTKTFNCITPLGTPKNLWSLGELYELKVKGIAEPFNFRREVTGKTYYAVSDEQNSQLYIGGGRFAEKDISLGDDLDCLGEIVHIVYLTEKAHLGDELGYPSPYIHAFGEEGGERPTLEIDADGFAHIIGGDYEITPLGIKN